MSKNFNKAGFEKCFKRLVPNFDETKIWFEHDRHMYDPSKVCFVLDGRLRKLSMHKYEDAIARWAPHFIEFLATGNFDNNAYWMLYKDENIDPADRGKVYAFPMKEYRVYDFDVHSTEMHQFLSYYRNKWPNCGIKQVPKPFELNP